jgi:hypothetical protein
MKLKIIAIFAFAMVMAISVAQADTLVAPLGTWQTMVAPNQDGTPFWDDPSNDGSQLNVGYILTGTNPPVSGYVTKDWIDYSTISSNNKGQMLVASGGGAVNNVSFTNSSMTGSYLIIEIAGNAGSNEFGIYDVNAQTFAGNHIAIFPGAATGGSNWSGVVSYPQYGFYILGPGGLFLSDPTAYLTSADATSNFAFFQSTLQPGYYYIGMEDLRQPIAGEGSLGDYNDMVVQIYVRGDSTVPVPPTLVLLVSGLLGLLGLRWRRRPS